MTDLVINFDRTADKQLLYDNLRPLSGPYCIKIEKQKRRRSYNQNKYYWGVVIAYLSEFTGYSEMETHCVCKHLFLPYVEPDESGFWSTSVLTTEEFEQYLELIRTTVYATFQLRIPLPNEVIYS